MFQQVIIIGNLGSDPELAYTSQGKAYTKFSVATSERWKDQAGQPVEQTTWFRVTVWGGQAEPCNQYLAKGRQVQVLGTLVPDKQTGSPRQWQDNDGNTRTSFELTARDVRFLGGAQQGQSSGGQQQSSNAPTLAPAPASIPEDEIPF